jgi:hypothetical protein
MKKISFEKRKRLWEECLLAPHHSKTILAQTIATLEEKAERWDSFVEVMREAMP